MDHMVILELSLWQLDTQVFPLHQKRTVEGRVLSLRLDLYYSILLFPHILLLRLDFDDFYTVFSDIDYNSGEAGYNLMYPD